MSGQRKFLLLVVLPMAVGLALVGLLGAGVALGWVR